MRSREQHRGAQARLINRICGAYSLRSIMGYAALLEHDYALAVVYLAILQASLAQVDEDPDLSLRYAGLDDPPPENLHRPISVHALSQSLHMPYETTRRSVGRLIDKGFVVRTSRSGVAAIAARQSQADYRRAIEQDEVDAMRMFAQLRRLGVTLER